MSPAPRPLNKQISFQQLSEDWRRQWRITDGRRKAVQTRGPATANALSPSDVVIRGMSSIILAADVDGLDWSISTTLASQFWTRWSLFMLLLEIPRSTGLAKSRRVCVNDAATALAMSSVSTGLIWRSALIDDDYYYSTFAILTYYNVWSRYCHHRCVCDVCPSLYMITCEHVYRCQPNLLGMCKGRPPRSDYILVLNQFWMWIQGHCSTFQKLTSAHWRFHDDALDKLTFYLRDSAFCDIF